MEQTDANPIRDSHAMGMPIGYKAGMLSFASFLRELLIARGLSGRAFAKLVGGNQSYVSKVLRGSRPPPEGLLLQWADRLQLEGRDRRWFLILADLEGVPPRLLPLFRDAVMGTAGVRESSSMEADGFPLAVCRRAEERGLPVSEAGLRPRRATQR